MKKLLLLLFAIILISCNKNETEIEMAALPNTNITVTLYPTTGKVNYSANNTSAAPADLVADHEAIKAKLIELQAEEQAIVNAETPAE